MKMDFYKHNKQKTTKQEENLRIAETEEKKQKR